MKNKKNVLVISAVLACGGAAAFGVYAHHASAEGIPSPNALYYSGVLEEAGVAVDGARDLGVVIYANGTTTSAACTASAPGTAVSGGHFRVALPASCTDAIHNNPDAYVEISVNSEALPRMAIGAVPYAVEADHAVTASEADSATNAVSADRASRLALESGAERVTFGLYVGPTANTTGRFVFPVGSASPTHVGLRAARQQCNALYAGSHMCTGTELVLGVQLGVEPPESAAGWYAADSGGFDAGDGTAGYDVQCVGWADTVYGGTNTPNGSFWNTGGGNPSWFEVRPCTQPAPILCCL